MSGRLPYRRPIVVSVPRSPPPASDADLVRACVSGDREAWTELHRRYHRLVRAKIRQRAAVLNRRDAVEDAEQAWWMTFPRMIRAWRPGPANLCTWIHCRAQFQLDRFLATLGRPPSACGAFEELRPIPQTPEEQLGSAEVRSSVRAGANSAARTPRDLELLEERLLADDPVTLQTIADRYGVTRQAIEDGQRNLLARLADVLSPLAA